MWKKFYNLEASIDPDVMTHNEPCHLHLNCLPSGLFLLGYNLDGHCLKFCRVNVVIGF